MYELKQNEDHSQFAPSAFGYCSMECSASVMLAPLVKNVTTYAMAEGTAAHWVAYEMSQGNIDKYIGETIKVDEFEILVSDDMIDAAFEYNKYIAKLCLRLGVHELYREYRVTLSGNQKRVYGYADCIIVTDFEIHIIDFKYGTVPIKSEENRQLMTYTLGAIDGCSVRDRKYFGHIFQPRVHSGPVSNIAEYSADLLRDMAKGIDLLVSDVDSLTPAFFSGSHCQYCKAVTICPSLLEEYIYAVLNDCKVDDLLGFDDHLFIDLDSAPVFVAKRAKQLKDYIKNCEDHIHRKCLKGDKIPGFKVVRKKTNRRWIADTDKVIDALVDDYGLYPDEISELKMFPINKIKDKLTEDEYNEIEADLIYKPEGAFTVVLESDKRKAVNSGNDFEGEDDECI